MLTVQDAILTLQKFWTDRGCMVVQPFNTEVGAGTMNPATVLRVLGPEPWRVAYPEPSVRPDDSRYGENPNRLQTFTQFQVILKPDPGNPQELYLESLRALGIDIDAHDVRFVEDNWAQPAIGAWGLGWEVWLDGLEITQFTYFQQVGGQNLAPVSVEITYGIERIMMAVQGVSHFKDMQYAPGISYGEAFGQSEYEMSRYYLDEADVEANQALYERYTAEAQRMVDERLPVPAHSYVLKASHAFNVLDARGAISTTQRANAFSTMRRLARDVSRLWVERREELGFPLLREADDAALAAGDQSPAGAMGSDMGGLRAPSPEPETVDVALVPTQPRTFALEIGVEELPPHVVDASIPALRTALEAALGATRLEHGAVSVVGTPRRLIATVADVAPREPDSETVRKGPKVAAAYDAQGQPTKALEGFARGQKVSLDELERIEVDGAEHVGVRSTQAGRGALEVLTEVVQGVVAGLRSDKNMTWSDPELTFSRPIRWVVALWGEVVVPARVSCLTAGRTTYVHRTDAQPHATLDTADDLLRVLGERGLVLDPAARRASVIEQARALAAQVGGTVDVEAEAALVDEITNLVEQPVGVRGDFEARYLDLPEQILTTVMRKHQRYLPVRDAQGRLLPHFVTMANGACDTDLVAAGNASVLRARYEDAAFFWQADLAVPLADFRARIDTLTFERSLGSMAQRADRIRDLARALADGAGVDEASSATLARAGELAKFDLSTQMVVELSSLAGTMAREYALRAGESPAVAQALAEMEQPRTAADPVPASTAGALLSLADRFDLLMGMFAIGAKPTGSSDPFGLRRAAIGVARVLREHPELGAVTLGSGLAAAAERLRAQGVEVDGAAVAAAQEFAEGRFGQQLRDEGVPAGVVAAVAPSLAEPGRVQALLADIEALRTGAPAFAPLVEGTQRITRIVPAGTPGSYDATLLVEPAEQALLQQVDVLPDLSGGTLAQWAQASAPLVAPLARFFDETLVMAPDEQLRAARLGLLQTVVDRAPAGVDWKALHTALDAQR